VILVKKLSEESVGKRIAITELIDQKAIDIVAYICPHLIPDTRPLKLTVLKAKSNVGFAKKHCNQDQ